jgi:hypothetical protein
MLQVTKLNKRNIMYEIGNTLPTRYPEASLVQSSTIVHGISIYAVPGGIPYVRMNELKHTSPIQFRKRPFADRLLDFRIDSTFDDPVWVMNCADTKTTVDKQRTQISKLVCQDLSDCCRVKRTNPEGPAMWGREIQHELFQLR